MFVVGITGGIGSGKSQVSGIFREKGALLLDADEISRKVTDIDGSALPKVRELLGGKFFDADGVLDRKKVAATVFSDRKLLDAYAKVIHDEVLSEIQKTLEIERQKGTKLVVLDVPIPVKKGFIDACNHVLVVSCEDELRRERLILRGMDEEDVRRRMAMQMSKEEYEELSDFVIENNEDIPKLQEKVNDYIVNELTKRGIRL